MYTAIIVLILVVCFLLALVVLAQNPKRLLSPHPEPNVSSPVKAAGVSATAAGGAGSGVGARVSASSAGLPRLRVTAEAAHSSTRPGSS